MNKKFLLLGASAAFILAACGDENTTNVTEMVGPKTLAKGEALKDYDCSKENIGEFVFVTDSAEAYYCDGKNWQSMKGEDGKNGASCTAKKNSDGDFDLTCDGEKIGTIKNGEDGKNGASCTAKKNSDGNFDLTCDGKKVGTIKNGEDGKNGASCTAKKNSDGSFDLSCDGENVGTIKNGENGKNGASCTAKKNSDGDFDLSCDGKSVGTIKNGEPGAQGDGCKINEGDAGVVTITCGEDAPVTLYKALCGTVSYDPEVDACIEGYLSCGVNVDDLKGVSFYSEDFNRSFADKFYNPAASFCHDGSIYNLCDGKTYDPAKQHCVDKALVDNPECDGVKYFPETQYCREKFIVDDYGYFVDANYNPVRVYKTIRIGSLEWFAENMNRETKSSMCIESDTDENGNCITYGRLYTYDAASNVCPSGWRLPTDEDLSSLISYVGEENGNDLKSTTGWGGYGTDEYGFAALAAGFYNVGGEEGYVEFDSTAVFWSSAGGSSDGTKYVLVLNNDDDESTRATIRKLPYMNTKNYASVRCVRSAEKFVVELN